MGGASVGDGRVNSTTEKVASVLGLESAGSARILARGAPDQGSGTIFRCRFSKRTVVV